MSKIIHVLCYPSKSNATVRCNRWLRRRRWNRDFQRDGAHAWSLVTPAVNTTVAIRVRGVTPQSPEINWRVRSFSIVIWLRFYSYLKNVLYRITRRRFGFTWRDTARLIARIIRIRYTYLPVYACFHTYVLIVVIIYLKRITSLVLYAVYNISAVAPREHYYAIPFLYYTRITRCIMRRELLRKLVTAIK